MRGRALTGATEILGFSAFACLFLALLFLFASPRPVSALAESIPFSESETGTRPGQVQQNRPARFSDFRNDRSVAENLPVGSPVGAPIQAIDPDGDSLYYALTNGALDMFTIDSRTGQLRTKASLDYENKPDDDYWVHVAVRDSKGPGGWTDRVGDDTALVVITVENADDPGTVTLNWTRPEVGTQLEATLNDPDGMTSSQSWQWARSDSRSGTYTNITTDGTSATYSPTGEDLNKYLRVTVNYGDRQGSGKSAQFVFAHRVRSGPQTNNSPKFSKGEPATRSIVENTPPGVNVGTPVRATNSDNQQMRYSLAWADYSSFSIDPWTGQLQTKEALDYETKSSYSVEVTVTDSSGDSDSISVTINVTNVPVEILGPSRVDYSEAPAQNSDPVAYYSVQPESAALTLTGPDARHFSIERGGLSFNDPPDYDAPTDSGRNNVYNVTINVTADIGGTTRRATKNMSVTVTNHNEVPVMTRPGYVTYVEHTTVPVGRYTARDPENDPIRWYVQTTDDHAFFRVSRSGVLTFVEPPDFETWESKVNPGSDTYEVVVVAQSGMNQAADGKRIVVTVTNAENAPPVFVEQYPRTRSVAENMEAGQDIGGPVYAPTAVSHTLRGTDARSFAIDSSTGQLQTKAALDYERKNSYTVTVRASDGSRYSDAVVIINVTNEDEDGVVGFSSGRTRSIGTRSTGVRSTTARANTSLTATLSDPDGGVTGVTWQWERSSDDKTTWDPISEATLATYTPGDADVNQYLKATVSHADALGPGKTSGAHLSNPVRQGPNRPPVFPDQDSIAPGRQTAQTRDVAENTPEGENIGAPVTATDPDTGDTLTYSLGGRNAASFAIDSSTGQLRTKAALDYENKSSYSVTVRATGASNASAAITVTITVTNMEEAGAITLSPAQPLVGAAQTATLIDPDGGISSTVWKWEKSTNQSTWSTIASATSRTYTPVAADENNYLRVTAPYTDRLGPSKTAREVSGHAVRMGNRPPPPGFPDQDTVTPGDQKAQTRTVAENTLAGRNIGNPVTAADADNDNLTYTLGGTNASSFAIVASSGQLQTKAALDYETKSSYTVTVTATDTSNASDTITVTINVTDVDEDGTVTLSSSWPRVGAPLTATLNDPDSGVSSITWQWARAGTAQGAYTNINTATAASYTPVAGDVNKHLRATASYTDVHGSGKTAQGASANAVRSNTVPAFGVNSATRSVAENTPAGRSIGAAVTATDADTSKGDRLAYTLSGTDAAFFAIVASSGQLRTKAALDHEAKGSYTVKVTATDLSGASDTITVTITVTDVNEPPGKPAAPAATAASANGNTTLSVTWTVPSNTGRPTITGYDLQYRAGTNGTWTNGPHNVGGTSGQISGLTAETAYQVQVRAKNHEGNGAWSDPGTGTTAAVSRLVSTPPEQPQPPSKGRSSGGGGGSGGSGGGHYGRGIILTSVNRAPVFTVPAWAAGAWSASGSPEGRSRPASSVQCPGAARTPGRPPGCSNPPPSPPCGPADTIPLGTFPAPSIGSKMPLWMAEGGTIFNRRLSVGQSAHPVQFTSADYREKRGKCELYKMRLT